MPLELDAIALIVTGGFTAMSAIGVALIQRNAALTKGMQATLAQVENSHGTNLRDDLDDIHETVRHLVRLVEGLGEEVRTERTERIALAGRVDHHVSHGESPCPNTQT